jgi:phosphoglucomutase
VGAARATEAARHWLLRLGGSDELAEELWNLLEARDERGIVDRFGRDMDFGTGGLRGVMGVGTNRMNVFTVRQASQGLADCLRATGLAPRVAIAHDTRLNGAAFAREAAGVFAANGVEARLFPAPAPTPALSFATRRMGCGAGVCITASHNPAEYNGDKVYGPDGGQVTEAAARRIKAAIAATDPFEGVRSMPFEEAIARGAARWVPKGVSSAYLEDVFARRLTRAPLSKLRVAYSPLNGAGLEFVSRALRRAGVGALTVVPEQAEPDGRFPTCPRPNPEEPGAMRLGARLAERVGADLFLATDPDADRLGVVARGEGGRYVALSGNEIGALLLDYICRARSSSGSMPDRPLAVKTIVTSELASRVARARGVEVVDVLTGFKYVGEVIARLEAAGEEGRFIFGFEESYGYLTGTNVRDKDGVDAALQVCDMAAWHKARGRTLPQALDALCREHGHFATGLDSFAYEGPGGAEAMRARMRALRESPPYTVCGRAVDETRDFLFPKGRPAYAAGFPPSDVLQFSLAGGDLVTVRPSGTEPKLKVYTSVSRPTKQGAAAALAALRAAARDLVGQQG